MRPAFYDDMTTNSSPHRATSLEPERRLMRAVLDDALRTHAGVERTLSARRRRVRRETDEWFASDDTEWPFSFLNVCRAIGEDPDRIRADLYGTRHAAA